MSSLAVGAMGRVRGRKTSVLGRIRCEHERGAWDEWYLVDGRDNPVWLIEEEGTFTLETPIENRLPDGLIEGSIGDSFTYMGASYQIVETGSATVKGGEGQLLKSFTPGEKFRYVDLTQVYGNGRLTVEVFDGEVHGFIGQTLRSTQLDFPKVWGHGENREVGQTVSCGGCGGNIDVRPLPQPVKTVSCKYCGRIQSLDKDGARLGKNEPRKDLHLMIGAKGTLKGRSYEVVGRMVYEELELDEGKWVFPSTVCWEYLLLDTDGGFASVEVTDEGVCLVRKAEVYPNADYMMCLSWGEGYSWNSRNYRMYERGRSKLIYVDGALPWVAKLDDETQFMDFIDMPSIFKDEVPERLSLEWSKAIEEGGEIEVFVAKDLDPTTLANAFSDSIHPVVSSRVLRPHRVSPETARFGLMWLGLGLVFVLMSLIASARLGTALTAVTVDTSSMPASALSPPFSVEDNGLIRVAVDTSANNSWLWAEVDLVDAESKASLGFVAKEISYFHGVEGGESWSEGSRRWRGVYKVPKGGQYRLRLEVSEARYKNMKATATIYKAPFDPGYPKKLSFVLVICGGLLLLRSRMSRPNLWPSDD